MIALNQKQLQVLCYVKFLRTYQHLSDDHIANKLNQTKTPRFMGDQWRPNDIEDLCMLSIYPQAPLLDEAPVIHCASCGEESFETTYFSDDSSQGSCPHCAQGEFGVVKETLGS